jgi:hypothetical protein
MMRTMPLTNRAREMGLFIDVMWWERWAEDGRNPSGGCSCVLDLGTEQSRGRLVALHQAGEEIGGAGVLEADGAGVSPVAAGRGVEHVLVGGG